MARGSANKTLQEIAQADDSEDEDYDNSAPAASDSRRRRKKQGPKRPGKKRRRGGYGDSDIDDGDSIVDDEDESFDEASEEEEVETNDNGRPMRKPVQKKVNYKEESSEQEESPSESDASDRVTPRPKPTPKRRQLIVKLKTGNTPRPTRITRARSASAGVDQAATMTRQTRRSNRLSHDEEDKETLVKLTDSGNHVEVARQGSRDPEDIPSRAMKGGKGLKYPSKSTIDEEPDSVQTKEEEPDEPEIKASQHEVQDTDPQAQGEGEEELPRLLSDIQQAAEQDEVVPDSPDPIQLDKTVAEEDDEDDEMPVTRGRNSRSNKRKASSPPDDSPSSNKRSRRSGAKTISRGQRRKAQDESSDFEPTTEPNKEDDMSSSSESQQSIPRLRVEEYDSSNGGRRSSRLRSKNVSRNRTPNTDEDLEAEVAELKRDGKKPRRTSDDIRMEPRNSRRAGKKPNYDLLRGLPAIEDEEEAAPSPSQRARKPGAGSWQRSLFSTYGPFGGAGGPVPILGGPSMPRAQGDVDSDSSDDEVTKQPKPVGGTVGMTPTTAGTFNFFPQGLNADPAQGPGGTPANLGKVKDKQALADADPLGVDQNVNFDSVGGLQAHIDQLKEMVALPLLYPEIFMRFKITPPRGVLFHGPPGTGKTLLARALASSVSSQGRKVTFYMRKGADALSKWVGEAERQLRLLFEEARKTQPSIIFFDEIDGLAPVRSSKQEQIHASIVSTLLALMDGMDGRGQVIVIGATNRPDSIDPALRRPGRFDREFYFPLPGTEARRAILDIHTRGWNPPLEPKIKDELAELTKGYGGADLRALCTEAALNAVQRRYPQIYASNEKLLIDPKTIEVTPKDFMISVKKMVPSSERSASSGAAPLPASIEPLLRNSVAAIKNVLTEIMPQRKRLTALQEAEFEDTADGHSFGRERMQQAFESSRVFRPRLLVHGKIGMGQQYVAAALLNHFEGLHVQNIGIPTLLGDTASTPEATLIRLFSEVKMHKPSVIYIPDVQDFMTQGSNVVNTFYGLLRSLKPTDPILVLGFLESEKDELDENTRMEFFGYSKKNRFLLPRPGKAERKEFFLPLTDYLRTSPADFPDPTNRKKRRLEKLAPAPPEPEKPPAPPTKEEQKAQKKKDRQILNMLKIRLQPIMDQIRIKHKKFRLPVIDESQIRYLYDEADPGTVTSDVPHDIRARATFRPFEIGKDAHGVPGLVEQGNDNFYYNLDTVTIEKRLSNGWYKRPKDFLADIRRLAKDAKTIGDEDRLLKANELLANVEVDIGGIEYSEPQFAAECEKVYQRELEREKEVLAKAVATNEGNKDMPPPRIVSNVPHNPSAGTSTNATDGPVFLGEPTSRHGDILSRFQGGPVTPSRPPSHSTSVMTNGVHPPAQQQSGLTNGTSPDEGHEADVEMGNTDSAPNSKEKSNETQKTHTTSSFGNRESAQPRPFHSYTAPSQFLRKEHAMSAPLSQTGAITPMPPGSQAADFQNEASTTQSTSGRKNNDTSPSVAATTGNGDAPNTQNTGPDLFKWDELHPSVVAGSGSQPIPDTQGMLFPAASGRARLVFEDSAIGLIDMCTGEPPFSQPSNPSQHPMHDRLSQQPPVPLFSASVPAVQPRRNSALDDILNPAPSPTKSTNLILPDESIVSRVLEQLADGTSGLTIEQMEQVNSTLMDCIWRTRGEWNRNVVCDALAKVFNETLEDMNAEQELMDGSWGRKGQSGGTGNPFPTQDST
jgi:ATPase family AAA domain-containing protein 2